jgi:serine/threonine protein phosphatase PrpC
VGDTAVTARPLAGAARSDAGRVRSNNEDLPVLDPERGIFGVIDGVGGHAGGEMAAAIARDVILQRLARPLGTPAERVREAIAIANNEIFRRAAASPELAGMTCVVTLAVVAEGRLTIGHVGDSRLYKVRPGSLVKLTHDHSPVGEREDAREIGEYEAMRHPRRHEVFRDVGSALRDKDEADYVEVVEDTLEDDAAILVCSDGLTDMIPSATIERIVQAHAGDAEAVASALVAAANEAGGRDNVTVVYAEGPAFATSMTATGVGTGTGTALVARAGEQAGATQPTRRRPLWFGLGAAFGLAVALLFAWHTTAADVGGRTLVAAPQASETVGTLAAAVQVARAGDVIRLEPGTYAESLVIPDGVSLRARVPGASVFVRPPNAAGDWVAIVARGAGAATISGVRIVSTPQAPIQVGISLGGQGHALELVQVDGASRAGVELLPDASATLHGGHFSVPDAVVTLAARSRLEATGNVFLREGGAASIPVARPPAATSSRRPTIRVPPPMPDVPAITMQDGAQVELRRNVFAGFGASPVHGLPAADREAVRAANVVVTSDRPASPRAAGVR